MDHKNAANDTITNRIGFHYFPDSLHYGEKDLGLWLPRMQQLNAQWLVLSSPTSRAIPEEFITAFTQSDIKTVVDFNLPLSEEVPWSDLKVLLRAYGKWGTAYALLNQRPNCQAAWSTDSWRRPDMLESHARQFIQFAKLALDCGVKPVFAPLVPGGDYWDLAFLEASLKLLADSTAPYVLNNLSFSAFAWDFGKSLDWGLGAAKVWKDVKAYKVPESSQDQHGFRAHEWYLDIMQTVLGKKFPMLLFQAGLAQDPLQPVSKAHVDDLQKQQLIYRLLNGKNVYDPENSQRLLGAIAPEVKACSFFLLSAADSAQNPHAWFALDGSPLPPAKAILALQQELNKAAPQAAGSASASKASSFEHGRYILIAQSLKPRMQEILQKMHAYITRYKPMIGFSCDEAKNSAYILVIAYQQDFPENEVEQLQSNGSLVRVIQPENLHTGFSGT